jgi:hypothetical protein
MGLQRLGDADLPERGRGRPPGRGVRPAGAVGADDPDLRWLVRENFRKSRMHRAHPERWARLRELAELEAGS